MSKNNFFIRLPVLKCHLCILDTNNKALRVKNIYGTAPVEICPLSVWQSCPQIAKSSLIGSETFIIKSRVNRVCVIVTCHGSPYIWHANLAWLCADKNTYSWALYSFPQEKIGPQYAFLLINLISMLNILKIIAIHCLSLWITSLTHLTNHQVIFSAFHKWISCTTCIQVSDGSNKAISINTGCYWGF